MRYLNGNKQQIKRWIRRAFHGCKIEFNREMYKQIKMRIEQVTGWEEFQFSYVNVNGDLVEVIAIVKE